MKNSILENLKKIYILIKLFVWFTFFRLFYKKKNIAVFISVPTHGNLGDQAIVYSQYKLMNDIGCYNIIELAALDYHRIKNHLHKLISDDDVIIIDGGGNIGTLWAEPEERMRDIIQRFPNNFIYIFPQTAYYEDSEYGKRELNKTQKIYEAHDRLVVFCRDKATYTLFDNYFQNVKHYYTPDIVLYINDYKIQNYKTNTILMCFREDCEKIIDDNLKKEILNFLSIEHKQYQIKFTSTVISDSIRGKKKRYKHLKEKWDEISSSSLVITDRLHCMIFCAITGTPCVAFDNISNKISNSYKWIEYLSYIHYSTTFLDASNIINSYLNDNIKFIYDRTPLDTEYDIIKKEVKQGLYENNK